uniref:Uncharacterized protein slr0889-like isoform X2 n=1 Tax=Rhizophora mucronata TaxID=61149 RepID=A0A2P2K6F6_RHIMU
MIEIKFFWSFLAPLINYWVKVILWFCPCYPVNN